MIRTAIVGAGGYSGAELTGLLAGHDQVELVGLFGSESRAESRPQPFSEAFPRWRGVVDMPIEGTTLDAILARSPDAVFLATPHEVSHDLAPSLIDHGVVTFDLSAAFRLRDAALYPIHYGFEHEHPAHLAAAAYGLAERNAEAIASADLIAVPGCYPTSITLPIAPLVELGALDASRPVIADSISGVSGAGRSPALKSLFCEVSIGPYGVLSHRHAPEIAAYCGMDVIFTPHLAPIDRGIVSTIHASLADGWSESSIRAALDAAYCDQPFIRFLPPGRWPTTAAVRDTNFCDIALAVDADRRHLIVASAIDNLGKGAAGQAVQCLNLRFGLPQTTGILGGRTCLTA